MGGFPDLDLSFLFCPSLSFFDFPGDFPDLSGDFPDWSFSSFSAYYQHLRGTVPKGSATQSGPFPKKSGKHPGLELPRFSFSQENERDSHRTFIQVGPPAKVHELAFLWFWFAGVTPD